MQPVEDIWTCNRCGWTYPNHHPSAKHRRNHKKVCGKVPGHIIDDHHGHAHGGSSDEASSGDENHHDSAPPTVTPTLAVERQSRSFDLSAALQKSETAALAATADEESAAAPLGVSKTTLQEGPKTEPVIEAFKPEDSQKPVLGSAVPHPEEDIWICRECGWTYPNAHPSAKHRRNHKKHCAGKAGAVVHGSSDDDSDVEHRARKGAESAVKANAAKPAPTEAEPEGQKAEPGLTPILSSTREFSLESGAPKERVPVAVEDAPKDVQATVAVVEAPTTPVPVVAPKGSAISHPDDDIWICKECGWTYPNHHPSAKHRRNHKKICPGKFAAVVPAPGGSSDEDSGDEHHHQSLVPEAKEAVKEAPPTESVAREFNLESLTNPAAIVDVQDEKKLESNVTLLSVVQLPEVSTDLRSDKAAVPEETEKEIPAETPAVESKDAKQDGVTDLKALAASKIGSAVPHPDDDIWICKACGWTYPNHHPSAKHRRNHKKNCSGKVAAAAPAPGGSSDEESGDEHHHQTYVQAPVPEVVNVTTEAPQNVRVSRDLKLDSLNTSAVPEIKVQQPENGNALRQVVKVVEVQASPQDKTPATPLVLIEVVKEEATVDAPPAVEPKEVLESVPAATPVVSLDNTKEKQSVGKTTAALKAGSAGPHPDDDIWICKECGWTYPNHHPSAKHRRNHKKNCLGKVGAAAPAPGGSSDEDSGDEHHHQTPVQAPKPNVVNVTNGVPPSTSVSREFSVELPVRELQATKAKAALLENAAVLPSVVKAPEAQAPSESTTPPKETTKEDERIETRVIPTVENVVVSQKSVMKDVPVATTPAVVPKEPSKEVIKVAIRAGSPTAPSGAVPHPEEDVWKCQHCNWTYPNAHPSAKHRRNHKKHCPGEAAAKGGSSDDDSDHETHSSALAKEHTPVTASPPTEDLVACVSRDVQLPTVEVKGRETSALPSPKLEEPTIEEAPPAPEQPQEKDVTVVDKSPPAVSSLAPQATGSAVPHPEDPNGMWICKACGWTYPNAHPSAKHKRNHKTHCPGKPAAVGHAPGGSSDDDSDNGSSHRGQKSAATSETAPVEAPVLQERAIPDLGGQQPNVAAKVEVTERAPLGQLVSEERSREQEAKNKEESKSSLAPAAPKAPHDPKSSWVCKECGWTYPNPHPSAKHRRNHKKVCKKTTNSTGGGSSSDASSDDEHIGHFGKKKCFPCL